MKNEPFETIERGGITANIFQDEAPQSPREWDNLGVMLCWHRRYNLGDKNPFSSPDDFDDWKKNNGVAICLPLFLYDHSGLSMSTRRDYPFNCPWDSGQVGWIYATKEAILKNWMAKKLTKKLLAKATDLLLGEVETFDQYLTGDVWGYNIETGDLEMGEYQPDSCWGFYGIEECRKEAQSALNYAVKAHQKAIRANENAWGLAVGSI